MSRVTRKAGLLGLPPASHAIGKFSSRRWQQNSATHAGSRTCSTEDQLRDRSLVWRVQSWMTKGCVAPEHDILKLFACIKQLVKIMKYSYSRLLWPIMIYVDAYIKRTRPIVQSELFPLLVVSASVAMKMWEDLGPDLDLTAFVTGISKKQISALERVFLEKLNYSLCLDVDFVEEFKARQLSQSRVTVRVTTIVDVCGTGYATCPPPPPLALSAPVSLVPTIGVPTTRSATAAALPSRLALPCVLADAATLYASASSSLSAGVVGMMPTVLPCRYWPHVPLLAEPPPMFAFVPGAC